MAKEVYFYCYGCLDYNKHHKDDADYEMKDTNLGSSLSEAMAHIAETSHNVYIKYEEYEEE